MSLLLHKLLTDGLDSCGLRAGCCDSDGTHSLQRIHECVMEFLFICSDEEKTIYILDVLKVSIISATLLHSYSDNILQ